MSEDIGGADGNVILEPPNYGSGFMMALKGHSQGHLLIAEGLNFQVVGKRKCEVELHSIDINFSN